MEITGATYISKGGGGVLQICQWQVDNDHEIVDLDNMTTELPASF